MARRESKIGGALEMPAAAPYFLPDDKNATDYGEHVEELCQGLSTLQRRRWLRVVRDGKCIREIAKFERVTERTIVDCFRLMARSNPYVRIYLSDKKEMVDLDAFQNVE